MANIINCLLKKYSRKIIRKFNLYLLKYLASCKSQIRHNNLYLVKSPSNQKSQIQNSDLDLLKYLSNCKSQIRTNSISALIGTCFVASDLNMSVCFNHMLLKPFSHFSHPATSNNLYACIWHRHLPNWFFIKSPLIVNIHYNWNHLLISTMHYFLLLFKTNAKKS